MFSVTSRGRDDPIRYVGDTPVRPPGSLAAAAAGPDRLTV